MTSKIGGKNAKTEIVEGAAVEIAPVVPTKNKYKHHKGNLEKEWPWEVPGFGEEGSECQSDTLDISVAAYNMDTAISIEICRNYNQK